MILTQLLKNNAKKFGKAKALTMRMGYRTHTYTYRQTYDLARKVAVFLEKQGVGKNAAVLVCASNSPYWTALFWACMLRGSWIVPLNTQSTQEVIEKIAQQTGARILFHHQFFKIDMPGHIKKFRLEWLAELVESGDPNDCHEEPVDENDIVEIMYTSGTTGDPKGVVLTHKNIMSNLLGLQYVIPLRTRADRMLSILPLSHIFEQTIGFLLPFAYASHIIYAHSHGAIRELLKEYKITKLIAVPEFLHIFMSRIEERVAERGKTERFEKLLNLSAKIGNKYIAKLLFWPLHRSFGGKLKLIASGGAPLDPDLERKWRTVGMYVLQGYGLTETSPVVTCNTFKHNRLGSVGKVLRGVDVRITDQGEIEIKGPNVFQGYYKNPEKTKATFTNDGWFKTGDMGEFDKDGFLFLKGRKKYMILGPGGQNVFPEDVESALNKISGVKDSCVIGLERGKGMPQVHAVLLLEIPEEGEKANPEKVVTKANDKLAAYQQVGGWTVWEGDDFPRTATKKIKKEEVKKVILQKRKPSEGPEEKSTKLTRILAAVTGLDVGYIHSTTRVIRELNLDSLMRVELIARIEEDYGVLVDETRIEADTTVEQLEEMIKTQKPIKDGRKLKKWPRSWWALMLRTIFQQVLFLFSRIVVRLRVEGREHLKGIKGPIVFMSNHLSYADPVVVAMALPARVRYRMAFAAAHDMLYEEYKGFALIGEFMLNAFSFPRKEHENIKVGLDSMGRLLDKNFHIIIYPEGKISEDGDLLPFKKGAGLVGIEMGVPVVPIKIVGTNIVLPYGKLMPKKRATVTVKFGKPLIFKKSDSYNDATKRLEAAMKEL